MPRKKTAPWYSELVGSLSADFKGGALAKEVENAARRAGRTDWPSPRTVSRLLVEWQRLPETVRQESTLFRWPRTMELGLLPWGAARSALEVLRYYSDHQREATTRRPTIRVCKWFHRLRLAAPGLPVAEGVSLGRMLAAAEFARRVGEDADVPNIDWRLAYEPWLGEENAATLFNAAQRLGLSTLGNALVGGKVAIRKSIEEQYIPEKSHSIADIILGEGTQDG